MSAWIVDKACIDLLVEAIFRYEIPLARDLTPDALGALLWKENYRSVNHRYRRRTRVPQYTHEAQRPFRRYDYGDQQSLPCGTAKDVARDPHMLYMQLACYQYQSCEHPGWRSSAAFRIACALCEAVLKTAGMSDDEMQASPRWDSAPWRIYYY